MPEPRDNWKHRSEGLRCRTCISFVPKPVELPGGSKLRPVVGRCRRNAPTLRGFPVVFESDWCGEHKLDEEKL